MTLPYNAPCVYSAAVEFRRTVQPAPPDDPLKIQTTLSNCFISPFA